ncbi:hypothetical protein BDZ97DRAFT_1101890 [Flammula alnicola]|nr:hypothetical protein BDZ97DRAFT_1101890 [Flammula alnicola]
MASGFGWGGGRSRCFSYWQEFQKCYAQTDEPSDCRPQNEDYLECLHRTKDIQRAQAVKAEYVRQLEHHVKEQSKVSEILSGGGITNVGLIKRDKPEEEARSRLWRRRYLSRSILSDEIKMV